MAQPRITNASPALLFERLIDSEPRQLRDERPFRNLTPTELNASIARELARILDTRRAISVADALNERPEDLTVLDYGIPDPTALTPQFILDRADLAAAITIAIRAFEPRLHDPDVKIDPDPKQRNAAVITVRGTVKIGQRMQPVSFPLALHVKAPDVSR